MDESKLKRYYYTGGEDMKRLAIICGGNSLWALILGLFGITIHKPEFWILVSLGAVLLICIMDGWFPQVRKEE
jgi:hypothetical protein